MREIALDTETTGISPRDGHRIIEIGALELMHHLPTGRKLHLYINPEREIDDGAVAVHGITSDFLADKPVFADIVDEFLTFVGNAMNRNRTIINFAFRIDIKMQFAACWQMMHQFQCANFNNTVPVTRANPGGFGIKSNFTHFLTLSAG